MGATTTDERPGPRLRSELPDPKLGLGETATRLFKIALLIGPAYTFGLAPEGSVIWTWAPLLSALWIVGLLVLAAANAERLGVRPASVTYAMIPIVQLVAIPLLAWRAASVHDPYWTGSVYPRRWEWWHRLAAAVGAVVVVLLLVNGVLESRDRGRLDGYVVRSRAELSAQLQQTPPRLSSMSFVTGRPALATDGRSVWVTSDHPYTAVRKVGTDIDTRVAFPPNGMVVVDGSVWAFGGGEDLERSPSGWGVRIDAETGKILGYLPIPEGVPSSAFELDGVVWVATDEGVWRLDPARARWISRTHLPKSDPPMQVVGFGFADNRVWVAGEDLFGLDPQTGGIGERMHLECCVTDLDGDGDRTLLIAQRLGDDNYTGRQRLARVEIPSGKTKETNVVASSPLRVPPKLDDNLYVQPDGVGPIDIVTLDGRTIASVNNVNGRLLGVLRVGGKPIGLIELSVNEFELIELFSI